MRNKDEALDKFLLYKEEVENQIGRKIKRVRSDRGGEHLLFNDFCEKEGIIHEVTPSYSPESNGVVERKNRSLEEMAQTMLCEGNLPRYFWAEAVNTACYILNRVSTRPIIKKTPYEIWKGRKPNIYYFHVFGCKCFVLNNGKDNLENFDAKSDEAIFLGYSTNSKAYRVFNKRTLTVEESFHITFNEDVPLKIETNNI